MYVRRQDGDQTEAGLEMSATTPSTSWLVDPVCWTPSSTRRLQLDDSRAPSNTRHDVLAASSGGATHHPRRRLLAERVTAAPDTELTERLPATARPRTRPVLRGRLVTQGSVTARPRTQGRPVT